MNTEVTAALVGGASGMAGALLGGAAAVWAARYASRAAVASALEAARSAYLGPLDTARRSAQREVFAGLLAATQDWRGTVEAAVVAAERWDQRAADHAERLADEGHAYAELDEAIVASYRQQVATATDPRAITNAVQRVMLEAAKTDVARAAIKVGDSAQTLMNYLDQAGQTKLRDPDRSLWTDPSQHHVNPGRSPAALSSLDSAIDTFAKEAAAHLNKRDFGNGPVVSA
ncbi:hypothetical protein [Streptomyces sp. NPDC047042]|uniref:hypothetical protein n=1 Tax=Streptomyces sp. NPDC047042 TaxID=3154807 RepID=UPI0033BFE0B5